MNWLGISLVAIFKAMHGLVKMPLFYGTIIIALLIFFPVLYFIYHNNNERLFDLAYASKNSNSLDQSNTGISFISTTQNIKDLTTSLADSIKKSVNKLIIEGNGNGLSYSGKITSAQINPNNGKVEKVFFGNWTLDSKTNQGTKFFAKFTMKSQQQQVQSSTINKTMSSLSSSTTAIEKPVTFIIENLKANSVQRANEDLTLGGTVDISEQGKGGVVASKSWKNIPVTISITNHASNLIITFDKNSPADISKEFSNLLLTGVVTSKSGNNNVSSGNVSSQLQTH